MSFEDDVQKSTPEAERRKQNLNLVLDFLASVENKDVEASALLNGESMDKDQMIFYIKQRFNQSGLHDMGTLLMSFILAGKSIPAKMLENKGAILTAHKYGPIWYSHLGKDFYNSSWKSFYGRFEVDENSKKNLVDLPYVEQEQKALELINNIDPESVEKYNERSNIKPVESSGKFAFYVTDQFPFETGLMNGYRVMVRFEPKKGIISVSILDEDTGRMADLDKQIRQLVPDFANSKYVGYLFAENVDNKDGVYTEQDAMKFYELIKDGLKEAV